MRDLEGAADPGPGFSVRHMDQTVAPGADFAKGTYWQLFNTVTFMTDHILGKSQDTRLTSAWYGYNRGLKTKALETAVEMANAA